MAGFFTKGKVLSNIQLHTEKGFYNRPGTVGSSMKKGSVRCCVVALIFFVSLFLQNYLVKKITL